MAKCSGTVRLESGRPATIRGEHNLNEQQRAELFDMWKRGAPFPEIATVVNGFIHDAAARASLEGELMGLVKASGPPSLFLGRG